jgi:hypothetical protein
LEKQCFASFTPTNSLVNRHLKQRERAIWEVFGGKRRHLIEYPRKFDGCHAVQATTSDPTKGDNEERTSNCGNRSGNGRRW